MFYVVDGDALVEDDFNFDYEVPKKDMNAVPFGEVKIL